MQNNKKITRRTFLKKAGKFVYLTPVMYTFFTDTKEVFAQGQRVIPQQQVDVLVRAAERGNQQAAVALQVLRERIVSPP